MLIAALGSLVWAATRPDPTVEPHFPPTGPTNQARHPITIRTLEPLRGVATGATNAAGEPVRASCQTCHASATPNTSQRSSAELDEFHQGLKYDHGQLTCLSCHDAKNYEALRLADGTTVEFPEVMALCGQCHGAQKRDYDRGVHGGMTGHWDLTRGPRQRNHCVHCHDPHAPAFPIVLPVFPPRDRISVPATDRHKRPPRNELE